MEDDGDRRAFAVPTGGGVVVIETSGLESDDPAAQAAYDQARRTPAVS